MHAYIKHFNKKRKGKKNIQTNILGLHEQIKITVFYNRYDIFSNTSNNFSKLLTHQHTYNTQLIKQLISCSTSHIAN